MENTLREKRVSAEPQNYPIDTNDDNIFVLIFETATKLTNHNLRDDANTYIVAFNENDTFPGI